ncbi:hypothetical protein ALI144C_37660 [Actinosynnema sp. ALI-1.44]|uniref:hypothetical protein n=1 Tax=Actinosynnema sp. ALI-1.44 TaxID=1933779 RepID=UPI00097C5291|nr:hypothetical protein [Actinosynnema sp. ALI-1.44]ONI76376.1 hypothetical protein ALI144C_37660 [Actinosynnema sp. ALI-1.44]
MPFSLGTTRDIPVRALKPCGLTWSGEYLWFSESVSGQISALDPVTGTVERRIACPELCTDLTTMGGNLVQVVGRTRYLRVIHPVSGEVVTELPNPRSGHALSGLEATRDGVWFGYEDLQLVDLRSTDNWRLIDVIPVRGRVSGLTASDSYVAYTDYRAGTINMVDYRTGRELVAYDPPGNPTGITWDGNRIWYCDYTTLQLRAIEVPGISGF